MEFLSTYPAPAELAEADRDELADIIYSLGFQNQRSKAIVSIGQALDGSGVPDDASLNYRTSVGTRQTPPCAQRRRVDRHLRRQSDERFWAVFLCVPVVMRVARCLENPS